MQSGPEEDTNHNKEERRPTIGENGNEEMDYNVEVALKIIFKNREFNCLLRPELEKDIIGFLNEINEGYIVDGSEEIQFLGDEEVIEKYDFCCNDVSPEETVNRYFEMFQCMMAEQTPTHCAGALPDHDIDRAI